MQIIALSEDGKRTDFEAKADEARKGNGFAAGANGDQISAADWQTSAQSRKDAAKNDQLGAIVLASAGGAMVITGIVLIATGGSHQSATAYKSKSKSLFADFSFTPTATGHAIGAVGTF